MSDKIKVCKDCKWSSGKSTFALCLHEISLKGKKIDPVTGKKNSRSDTYYYCSTMRQSTYNCGMDEAKHFEQKEPTPTLLSRIFSRKKKDGTVQQSEPSSEENPQDAPSLLEDWK